MTTRTTAQAFADAAAALVQEHDVTDVLASLIADSADLLDADAAGLLVKHESRHLELLSSTSHKATELELFQIQHNTGPCFDSIETGEAVSETSPERIRERWGAVGAAIVDAGMRSVHAFPMRWHGRTIGGLNVFASSASDHGSDWHLLGQAFADVATIVVVHTGEVPAAEVTARIRNAIASRAIIEQAKGVLAFQHNLAMAKAYEVLMEQARSSGRSLTDAATAIVDGAYRTS